MKILVAHPGKLRTVPMGRFTVDALRKLGHEAIEFDLSSGWGDKAKDRLLLTSKEHHGSLNQRFRSFVKTTLPEVVLTIFGFDLSQESLRYLEARGILRICWWLNDPFQFSRSLSMAANYDLLFTNSRGSVDDYRAAGITHAYWLPTACAPEEHRLAPARPEYRCEICFAGDWSPLRESWCAKLAEHFDLRIFGPWRRKLQRDSPLMPHVHDGFFTPEEMVTMFASADVVFNLHSWYGKWAHGTNPRLFEAAGCAACQVVDWKEDIPALFDTKHEMRTYATQEELVANTRQLLADAELRRAMGLNAQRRAYADHTYEARMRNLIDRVERGA